MFDIAIFEKKVEKDDTTVIFANPALGIHGIYYWKNKIFLLIDSYRVKNDDFYVFENCYKVNSINIDTKRQHYLICLKIIKNKHKKIEELDKSELRNLVITCIMGIEKIFEKEILDEIEIWDENHLSIIIKESFFDNNKPIFEDDYAWHYRYGLLGNLKVYKQNSEVYKCIDEIEKNIDALGYNAYIDQEDFFPFRKAVDINGKLIGYIYDNFEFSKDGIDLADKRLNNLAKVKGLIRLITQMSKARGICTSSIYPLTHVFISKKYKHKVQILNIELLMLNPDHMESYVYEYVRKIVNSNDDIKVNIPAYNESQLSLDEIKNKLQNLNYCSNHNVCYDSMECPKCVELFREFNEKDIQKTAKSIVTNQSPLNEGGEAIIYPYKKKLVAKVFKQSKTDYVFKRKVIERILSKKEILKDINNQNLKYKYIFPEKILFENKHKIFYGYIMTRVEGKPLSILRDKKVVKELGFSKKDVLEILITVGEGIETLHEKANIYIGDLNGRNILFDEDKNVYFLDFDGMGVDDLKPVFYTEGYIDPISQKNKNITMKDDWYSFAIQAFYYLTFTHPFNGIYQNLNIVEKMESKISLLGKHRVKPPTIAENWNWMNKELLDVFLNTFEGDTRRSIVPELKAQYKSTYGITYVDKLSV